MTTPHSDSADDRSNQPGKESAAVPVHTNTASDQDTERDETTSPVDGETKESTDTADTVGTQDPGDPEAATSDGSEAKEKAGIEPAEAKRLNGRRRGLRRRLRAMTKPRSGDTAEKSDQPDEESVDGEGKDPEAAVIDDSGTDQEREGVESTKAKPRIAWSRVLAYGVLPGLALLLALAAGFLKWQDSSVRASQIARIESVAAAKDGTIALLSYKSDTVDKDLDAARDRLTGTFKESYIQLTRDVVIPGAKQQHLSATATVPAVASVSATPGHAVTLLFVNQSAAVGNEPPSETASSVRVTLDKIAGRWLISGFDPV